MADETQEPNYEMLDKTSFPIFHGRKLVTVKGDIQTVEADGTVLSQRPALGLELDLLRQIWALRTLVEEMQNRTYIQCADNEPYFVLLGRDPQAPALVEKWAYDRKRFEPESPKWQDAANRANLMRMFKQTNPELGMPMSVMHETEESILTCANELIINAFLSNIALTIDLVHVEPLSMGNYIMTPSVRRTDYPRTPPEPAVSDEPTTQEDKGPPWTV